VRSIATGSLGKFRLDRVATARRSDTGELRSAEVDGLVPAQMPVNPRHGCVRSKTKPRRLRTRETKPTRAWPLRKVPQRSTH